MKVLIACEFSGIVRDAFMLKGHDAVSCDLLPTERPGPHIQGDALEHLDDGWDLMIAHPPCTYIAFSGIRWNVGNPDRMAKQDLALEFVRLLLAAPVERICLENPIGVITRHVRRWDQIVQPWMFGHPENKAHCLWLKNLPMLVPTCIIDARYRQNRIHLMPPSALRSRIRSRTYQGIADAMAEQWGTLGPLEG